MLSVEPSDVEEPPDRASSPSVLTVILKGLLLVHTVFTGDPAIAEDIVCAQLSSVPQYLSLATVPGEGGAQLPSGIST